MKIKHWQGYGCVTARKLSKDHSVRLHIVVTGDHEWGIVTDDDYTLWNWLVRRFEHDVCDYAEWNSMHPQIRVVPGQTFDLATNRYVDECHYYFDY